MAALVQKAHRAAAGSQAGNQVVRAAAMPMVTDAGMTDTQWLGQVAATSGINYAAAKLGTQSYSAGTLTGNRN